MAGGKNSGQDPNWAKLAAVGFEVALGVGLGALAGTWIDKKYNCDPWGLIIGTALGFATGMYMLIKEAWSINKNDGDK